MWTVIGEKKYNVLKRKRKERTLMNIKKFFKPTALVFLIVVAVYLISRTPAAASAPGTDANPLIAKDYFDMAMRERDQKITALTNELAALTSKINQLTGADVYNPQNPDYTQNFDQFVRVRLTQGQSLIVGDMTEMMIAGPGRGIAIAGRTGGISDLSYGRAIKNDDLMPNNRLYFIPESDDYGVRVMGEIGLVVYIKGSYEIR